MFHIYNITVFFLFHFFSVIFSIFSSKFSNLFKKMAALSENNFSDVKKSITGLREKLDSLDNGTAEKMKALKKSLIELEDK